MGKGSSRVGGMVDGMEPIVISFRQAIHGLTCSLARITGAESELALYGAEEAKP